MEHAPGVQLHGCWPSMATREHLRCVRSLSLMIYELFSLKFPAYGSLYSAGAPLDSALKVEFGHEFCIGPHCGINAWPCSPLELAAYDEQMSKRGPCKSYLFLDFR